MMIRPEQVETTLVFATRLLMQNETTMEDKPYEPYSSSSSATSEQNNEEYSDVVWMILWFLSLSAFIFCPFCGSARRRELCFRRIRERRWIHDDEFELEEQELQRRQARLREREQRRANRQHELQISRTQEDEIREQFLNVATEKYSKTISEDDIFESDHQLVKSASFRTPPQSPVLKPTTPADNEHPQNDDDDIESGRRPAAAANKHSTNKNDATDEHDEDEEDFMLVEDFQETNEVVRVPLPGQQQQEQNNDGENDSKPSASPPHHDHPPTPHRFVPNGCAICLSKFEADETVTWSSNPNCSHVYHKECVIHWYLAVGKKTQQRRERLHPDLDEIQLLEGICKFPMLCPCCRQTFCYDPYADNNKTLSVSPTQSNALLEATTSNETTETITTTENDHDDNNNGGSNNIMTVTAMVTATPVEENEASC